MMLTDAPPYPGKLSDTMLFADLDTLAPASVVESDAVNFPLWSDHAKKRRWFAISNLADGFGWRRDGPWDAPIGAVWIKRFVDLDLDRSYTYTRRRIGTCLLVRTKNGAYGVSYRWNAAGTEVSLSPNMGNVLDLSVTYSGTPAIQRWILPSRAECFACHRPDAGFVLGFDTRHLNRHGAIGGVSGDQIALLDAGGWFTISRDYSRPLPRHLHPIETNDTIEARVRFNLAFDCGQCHQGPGAVPYSARDGRAHVLLEQAGMGRVPPLYKAGNTNYLLLAPGDLAHIVIHRRITAASDYARVPPLSSTVVDEESIQLIADWIAQLAAWPSCTEWRDSRFGSMNFIASAPDADPVEDGSSNGADYLAYTNVVKETDWWPGRIRAAPSGVVVEAEFLNRSVWVETSSDLVSWSRWAVSANDGIPSASDQVLRLIATTGTINAYFRFRICDY